MVTSDDELMRIVLDAKDLKTACKNLIDAANDRGGTDNITVALIQLLDD
jgi:serine/threonine protein phosphatase PrpC